MESELSLRVVLEKPPAGVDFGLQEGKGPGYRTVQTQRSDGGDLRFEARVTIKGDPHDGLPNFLGPMSQGPAGGRFLYIDIGQSAGQAGTVWDRRIKVTLAGITWAMIEQVRAAPDMILEARLPGTGKDGGPSCASVPLTWGWAPARRTP